MSKWSTKFTKKITVDFAYFITKRLPTVIELNVNNLYNAVVEINSATDYIGPNICVVKTNSGCYIMIKCDNEERCNNVFNGLNAMYDHCREIESKIVGLKMS